MHDPLTADNRVGESRRKTGTSFPSASAEWISNSSKPAPSARESSTSATAWRANRHRAHARVEQRIRDAKTLGQRAVIDLAKRWDDPDFSMEQKQAAIARTLSAVIVMPVGKGAKISIPTND
jgi:hypothetical protein